ncbi:eukaryotic translation initiation factor 3 subunit J [Aplysia californica]|uniref:Eukaryotic translation initiation factor 3 subunit J n=1 Tax=Aplysia californica TaxID=6500 RepID=A0ABM0JED2_APLCA|nr:eukaryotic translation initiation factor 3 subunit J [Aplysia californica]
MDDWENEDFEPAVPGGNAATDKWEGEDEDEDVKESWEDDDDEKKPADASEDSTSTAYQRPKKKPLAERIAEKNRAKQEAAELVSAEKKELTAEEKLAEKIRLQKIQEEADLKLAKGLFGVQSKGIDSMFPETKEEFDEFAEALKTKITFFESSKLYGEFLEKLINDISVTLPPDNIKKVGIALNSLFHEKDRQRKEQAKSKKKKQKASIRLDKADDLGLADATSGGGYFDDDDDFI